VIRPAVDSALEQLPVAVRDVVTKTVEGMSDVAAVDFIRATGYPIKLDPADISRRIESHRAAQANGHDGGVKTARKRRMGLLSEVDPAGKKWKPDHTSPLDKTIFPKWGRIPVYIPALARDMNRVMLATIVLIGEVVDRKGRFKLARATHAEKAGCAETKAYAALKTLEAAGLVYADIPGDQDQATIWRYRPVAAVNIEEARRIILGARKQATTQLERLFQQQPVPVRDKG
jgi:hypothetical protein